MPHFLSGSVLYNLMHSVVITINAISLYSSIELACSYAQSKVIFMWQSMVKLSSMCCLTCFVQKLTSIQFVIYIYVIQVTVLRLCLRVKQNAAA